MNIIITLTTAGADTGPFNLYSDIDGYLVPFVTGVLILAYYYLWYKPRHQDEAQTL